jgi:HEPN domain-containing protein
MTPEPAEEAVRWLTQARAELAVARDLAGHGHFHAVCFHAQQAAELALKAFLYGKGEQVVIGHSVQALCDWAGRFDAAFVELAKTAAKLDSYYIGARYPNGLPAPAIPARIFKRADADEAVALTERTLAEVAIKLGL